MISKRNGQSLVDILIGSALIVLVIGFSAILVFGGQQILIDRDSVTQAINLAQGGIQGASLILHKNWNGYVDGDYGLSFSRRGVWSFNGTQDQQDIYTRRINVRTINLNQKEIKSTVSWTSGGRSLNVEFVSRVTSWLNVIATGGDTGGSGISGNWQNPQTAGSIDLGSGVSATDLDVKNKIVYMTGSASSISKNDFFVIDATNPASPTILSKINVGSKGLNAVDVAGSYAYVANQDGNAQFMVINVSNLSSSTIQASIALPNNDEEDGISIFYRLGKIYIGTTENSDGPEFYIIDVSIPASPVVLGSKEINANVNAIYVNDDNNTVYLATSDDSQELKIFDVSTPTSINQLGSFNATSSADGKTAYFTSSTLYFGQLVAGSGGPELYMFDVSNPSSIQTLGTKEISYDVNDFTIRDNLLFMATNDSNKEFQIWKVSVASSTTLWGSLNLPQDAAAVDFESNFVYLGLRSNDALRIITSGP